MLSKNSIRKLKEYGYRISVGSEDGENLRIEVLDSNGDIVLLSDSIDDVEAFLLIPDGGIVESNKKKREIGEKIFDKFSKKYPLFFSEDDALFAEKVKKNLEGLFSDLNAEEAFLKAVYNVYETSRIKEVKFDDSAKIDYKRKGTLVKVKPCADEYGGKTYLGLYLGDMPTGIRGQVQDGIFKVSFSSKNPYIYIFETNSLVWGAGSFWSEVKDKNDIENLEDLDTENVWYVQLLKKMAKSIKHECDRRI